MSHFIQKTIHPITKNIEDAYWIDNLFGTHQYGVKFKDGSVFFADEVDVPPQDERQEIYHALIKMPEWGEWVKLQEEKLEFDVHETIETGLMTLEHMRAFLNFVKNNK